MLQKPLICNLLKNHTMHLPDVNTVFNSSVVCFYTFLTNLLTEQCHAYKQYVVELSICNGEVVNIFLCIAALSQPRKLDQDTIMAAHNNKAFACFERLVIELSKLTIMTVVCTVSVYMPSTSSMNCHSRVDHMDRCCMNQFMYFLR